MVEQRQIEAAGGDHPAPGDALAVVVFTLDGGRYGVALSAARRVLPMAAVAPLPGCPDAVLGAINVHGHLTPVFDLRRRLGLAPREYGPSASLLLAQAAARVVALPVDDVHGVEEIPAEQVVPPSGVLPGVEQLAGVAALADGLLLITDLDAFLSLEQERQLDDAIVRAGG